MSSNGYIQAGATQYPGLILADSDPVPRSMIAQLHRVDRPGIDGAEYTLLGARPRAFRLHMWFDFGTASECRTRMVYFNRLSRLGTLVDLYDPYGKLWTDLVILRLLAGLKPTPHGTGINQSYGSSEYVVDSWWTLEQTAVEQTE